MADTDWIPFADRQLFDADGKPWRGGTGKPKLVLHTMECVCWPRYNSGFTAPHVSVDLDFFEVRQHIPHRVSAYSLRENDLEDDRFTYQIEMQGRARETANWPDHFYRNLAVLVKWYHDNLDVPYVFADFSVVKAGPDAPQRMSDQAVRDFSGVMGHCHFGRDVDTHWDPGRLDVPRLEFFLGLNPTAPPSRPIDVPGDDMLYPMYKTDGYDKPTAPGRTAKREDVAWLQSRINDLLGDGDQVVVDGKLGPATLTTFHGLAGSERATDMISGAEGAKFDRIWAATVAGDVTDLTARLDRLEEFEQEVRAL